MHVAGVDLSSHAIDIVLINLETRDLEHHRYLLEGQDAWERTRSVRNAMPTRTSQLWDTVIGFGIEDPRGYNAGRLFRIQGAVLSCLPAKVLIHPYVPARWRVLSGLKGYALKAEVAERSLGLGGDPKWPQDAHDAHLIGRALLADLEAQRKVA